MGKPFAVRVIKGGRFFAISFALDATRPEEYYAKLEKDLARLNFDGDILLDLLACNGQSSRRFVAMRFDGRRLAYGTLRVERESALEPSILDMCSNFFIKNHAKLGQTVLSTPALKKLQSAH